MRAVHTLPGMRLVRRANGRFDWVHRMEMLPTDFDCTDMDDVEFERFVRLGTTEETA